MSTGHLLNGSVARAQREEAPTAMFVVGNGQDTWAQTEAAATDRTHPQGGRMGLLVWPCHRASEATRMVQARPHVRSAVSEFDYVSEHLCRCPTAAHQSDVQNDNITAGNPSENPAGQLGVSRPWWPSPLPQPSEPHTLPGLRQACWSPTSCSEGTTVCP